LKPVIGISTSFPNLRDGAIDPNVVQYVESVRRAGGTELLLQNDPSRVDEYLSQVDGIVLSGGRDIDPVVYGGRALPEVQSPDPPRDAFELALVRAARERGVPTLCVCRGLQLANVAFGGTLIEDLPHERGERYTLAHQQVNEDGLEREEYAPGHDVHVAPGSALAALLGTTSFATNSMHHQAVRDVAPSLRVVAATGDGVIEALDAEFEHPFFYAVQWHPEALPPGDPVSAQLFGGLVRAAAAASTSASARG
jgi:gamma-glutamyl-gamma-aminobutyrate hydrolase PuuD